MRRRGAAHPVSPRHPVGAGHRPFAGEPKKEAGGRISIGIFAAGSPLGAETIADGVDFLVMTCTPPCARAASGRRKGAAVVPPDPGLVKARAEMGAKHVAAFVARHGQLHTEHTQPVTPIASGPAKPSDLLQREVRARLDPARSRSSRAAR